MKYLLLLIITISLSLSGWLSSAHAGNADGSLWSDDQSLSFLFTDYKARKVGDIVTIRIIESSKGDKKASTKTAKESSVATTVSALFGVPDNTMSNVTVGAETSEEHDGNGITSRSSNLSAVITAKVIDVMPNGNLVVDGRREIVVNNEKQIISITGIIRPEDIGPNNTILSTYIADAQITYTGKGVIAEKQKVGWLVRLLDIVWPF